MSLRTCSFGLVTLLSLASTGPAAEGAALAPAATRSADSSSAPFETHVLTADRTAIRLEGDRRRLEIQAQDGPLTGFWSRRTLLTGVGAPASRDHLSCATWSETTDAASQEGLALRVRADRGRVRAVTVTKNTIHGVDWYFNVMTWDTARVGEPWRLLEQHDMSPALSHDGVRAAYPWRVCARTVGRVLSFKAWLPRVDREPAWGDPLHTRTLRLPRSQVATGRPGWYVGHVPRGESVVYTRLRTRGLGAASGPEPGVAASRDS